MSTQLIFLSLSLSVGVAPAKKSPKLVSTGVLFSFSSHFVWLFLLLLFSMLFLLIIRVIGLVEICQGESDMHFNAIALEVDGETMWSGLGGVEVFTPGKRADFIHMVTWAPCNSPLIIYQRQQNQQVRSLRDRTAINCFYF